MSKKLSENDLSLLRQMNLILESEIAYKEGDIIIAENPITKERRIVNTQGLLLESNKKILLG